MQWSIVRIIFCSQIAIASTEVFRLYYKPRGVRNATKDM